MTTNHDPAQPAGADEPLPLPGLEPVAVNVPPLVKALRRTVVELHRQGLVNEVDALDLAAAHVMARAAEMKLATGRASTIANDVDLLLRIKKAFTEVDDGAGVDDQLRAAMEDWETALGEITQSP